MTVTIATERSPPRGMGSGGCLDNAGMLHFLNSSRIQWKKKC